MTGCSRLAEIGVVAHTSRWADAARLADSVRAATVNVDDGSLGCEGNHQRTWLDLSSAETPWVVVLEDDAVPVSDFTAQLDAMLAVAPTPIVSLYLGRTRPPAWQPWIRGRTINADRNDACFITGKRMLHAVGIAMHTNMIHAMVSAIAALDGCPIDEAITAWANAQGHTMAYCWPSIVDHSDGPTLVEHRDGKPRLEPRIAWSCGSRSRWHATALG